MTSFTIRFDNTANAEININLIYNQFKKLYPDIKNIEIIEHDYEYENLKKPITFEEIEELCGIVRSDIDENAELESWRKEKYADFS